MKAKKVIYVSGPMTGLKDNNYPAFKKATKQLRKKGYVVISPVELDRYGKHRTWARYLRRDITHLVKCDAIATLAGWTRSRGATLEVYIGDALGMEVHPLAYYTK